MDQLQHDRQHRLIAARVAAWKADLQDRQKRRVAHLSVQGHLSVAHGLGWKDVVRLSGKSLGVAGLSDALAVHDGLA